MNTKPKSQPEPNRNLSPNLLKNRSSSYGSIAALFRNLIFLIHFLFIVVLVVNSVQNNKLTSLKNEVGDLIYKLDDKLYIFDEIELLNNKILVYQEVEQSKIPYAQYLESVNSSVFPGIIISRIRSEDKRVDLFVKTDTGLNAAKFIAKLLESESVTEVVLNSASLNSQEGGYDVRLGVVFR